MRRPVSSVGFRPTLAYSARVLSMTAASFASMAPLLRARAAQPYAARQHADAPRCAKAPLLTRSASGAKLGLRAALHAPEERPSHGAASQQQPCCRI